MLFLKFRQSMSDNNSEKYLFRILTCLCDKMMGDFLQDWMINKLNGYFIRLYADEHFKLALVMEKMNDLFVFLLVVINIIPPRRRLTL